MSEILRLKRSNCRNCYKCIRNCPVQAIRFYGNQAYIANDMCVYCGQCMTSCPQNAKECVDSTEAVWALLRGGVPVIASVSPTFAAYYRTGFDALRHGLLQLGFTKAEETTVGAALVQKEYERLLLEGEQDVIITSACHTVNLLIRKYYPELLPCLAPVVTPMEAHKKQLCAADPQAKVVYIGPCLSAKEDAIAGAADEVLTFEELDCMLAGEGISVAADAWDSDGTQLGLFSVAGGILRGVEHCNESYTYLAVDGMENCRAVLDEIKNGNIHRCFVEMSACEGGCVGGPFMKEYAGSPVSHYQSITRRAGKAEMNSASLPAEQLYREHTPIPVIVHEPGEKDIVAVLRRMGKNSPEQELNCGHCGYNTCREMAAAVCRGKADVNMCQPFVMDKSEHFTTTLLDNTPNGILILNESLEIQRINRAAMKMLHIGFESDVVDQPVMNIMDPVPFMDVLQNHTPVVGQRDYYAEYGIYLEQTIVHDAHSQMLLAFLRDVTAEESDRQYHERLLEQTAETADKVVDKQMRIVQEIASLLGEAAAETKIALTKLKESMSHEHEHEK